jgi:hypothetical protein
VWNLHKTEPKDANVSDLWLSNKKRITHLSTRRPSHDQISKTSVETIIDKLHRKFGPVFSNTICYIVARLIDTHEPGVLFLSGILMDEEYSDEVSNLSYLLGMARGLGWAVVIEGPSRLRAPQFYYRSDFEPKI